MHLKMVAAAAAMLLSAGTAAAAPVTFVGSFNVVNHVAGSGLETVVDILSGPGTLGQNFSFSLDGVGDSKVFDLFDIWTPEETVNISDDFAPKDFSLNFSFTAPPPPFGGSVGGETGTQTVLGNLRSEGYLEWDDAGVFELTFGYLNDGLLRIELTDALFNRGTGGTDLCLPFLGCRFIPDPFDLDPGAAEGASVMAKFTLVREATPVPEPGAIMLLGAGLTVLGLRARRRKAA